MADNQLLTMVNYIERENGVDREIVLVAIEQAIQQAARRNPGVTNDLRVVIDRKTITLHVYDTMVVSDEDTGTGFISVARAQRLDPSKKEGDTIEIELPASRLGRIAAQTSRQMIMQKLREAIRSLPAPYGQVVWLRFAHRRSQTDVARALGVGQPQVSRWERQACQMLRATLLT